ncbi:hypothetical protein SAMN05421493_102105 [Pseudobutyrivibrio sp. 49]|nr:hypothetical protein SAMN05421493_102105 [Pseudobutyrivibrio sp. 49]
MISAILLFMFIYRKLKKSQLQVNEAFFWIVFSSVLVILGFFPEIAITLARKIGIISPSNFIFLCIIFLLIIKVFLLTIKVSSLEQKVSNLVQEIAIRERDYAEKE